MNRQYNYSAAKTACGNVAGLLSWTIAMSNYFEVNKEVLPLKANLAFQNAKYLKAINELEVAENLFKIKEQELIEVQAMLDDATHKKNIVLEDAKNCQEKMDTATALIEGLHDEKIRWTDQLALFQIEIERLVGDTILTSGFLTYAGPFNQEFRDVMLRTWFSAILQRKVPVSSSNNFIENLTDRSQIGEWNLMGLPADEVSIQNGIIATKAFRFPLLIDPQTQAESWIKNKEKSNDLIVTSFDNKYFKTHIEDAVSLGRPILIEDAGEIIDPCLNNILAKNYIKVGTAFKVKIGDKLVDFNENYRIYITTKLSNPKYTPDVYGRMSVIDFAVTTSGLEDQLLSRVILIEKRELEEERMSLIENITKNRKFIKELEANLLQKLSTIKGSLLEDISLIQVLNFSKNTATEIKQKMENASITETKINTAREEYRSIAKRGSALYFLVCSMTLLNCMYQTSLQQFLERFDISLYNSKKTQAIQKRIKNIIDYLTYEIYRYISRGLYENHKFLFTLLMAIKMDILDGNVSDKEFQNFIQGGAALSIAECQKKPPKWITDEIWLNLEQLSNLRQFANISRQVIANEQKWRKWYRKESPEEEKIPDGYNNMDPFRKLLLIRAWCPDRTISQSRKYISYSLGEKFISTTILSYDDLILESRPLTPLINFLSIGSDPTATIKALAKKNELNCYTVSMGQGQDIQARNLLSMCAKEGAWILLQNCHLNIEYMHEIATQFLGSEKININENFRIWMTTEYHDKFSIDLLQQSIKFTDEPPCGIQAGLKRTYKNLSQEFLDYSESKYYHPLVFAISFLHSIVLERRKYGPIGWNTPYEFNSADWYASCVYVQKYLDDLDSIKRISWTTIRYMLAEVQYGGRVTDDYDKRLLNTFTKVWFTDDLFNQNFSFFKGYPMITFKLQEEYLSGLEEIIPSTDSPLVFGLHSNAETAYQTNTTKQILSGIITINPKSEKDN